MPLRCHLGNLQGQLGEGGVVWVALKGSRGDGGRAGGHMRWMKAQTHPSPFTNLPVWVAMG